MQVCWEKFCRYFEIEPRYVPVMENFLIMDPEKAMSYIDEVGCKREFYSGNNSRYRTPSVFVVFLEVHIMVHLKMCKS